MNLISAFHQVRDVVLKGKIPLVFFDEFDSNFQGLLGWLKYFIDPMQSGHFKDGESIHPIGKSIFIFAGATSSTLKEFSRVGQEKKEIDRFKEVKGPDFVSRLRGYVDILGLNPISESERLYMIRRAVALRIQLYLKAKHIFDSVGRANIDKDVLRALIKVPEYKHGMRSMGSILDMSVLSGRRSFEQSALPPANQLDLHVDAKLFSRLMASDILFGAAREKLARAIHEAFRKNQKGKKSSRAIGMKPWEELPEDFKESNRQQADSIPLYLKAVGYGFQPVIGREINKVRFTAEEVEIMSEMEHKRFVAHKLKAGWKPGERRDEKRMINPTLVDWEKLPKSEKDKDHQTVCKFPDYLAEAGFEIYKLGR
ncbi:MAG: hypothetical protein HZA77_08245 [Candidatus Schekmanbacteria bacterium]|nr:hypothetical protein [Candidatus Schekmanbacteria bacterium]